MGCWKNYVSVFSMNVLIGNAIFTFPMEAGTAIGHFRVSPSLCIRTRLSAQPLIWKWFFILMQIKLISTRKVVYLASFWKWGFLELGSGQFNVVIQVMRWSSRLQEGTFFPHTIGVMGLELKALTWLNLLSMPKSQKKTTNKTRVGAVPQVTKLWYDSTVKSMAQNTIVRAL